MQFIMFTKHLQGLDLPEIVAALQSVGVEGADLCVRPGYPVHPENAERALPDAARRFAEEGLSIPLDEFAFVLSADRPPQLRFSAPGHGDPSQWQCAQLSIESRFQLAIAIRRPVGRGLAIRVCRTVPLRWQDDGRLLPPEATNRWSL